MKTPSLDIDVWGINYHPEPLGISVYSTQMCEYLASKGHRVRATTGFPYYPTWRKMQDGVFVNDTISGVPVRRCWLYVPAKATTNRRILHELSFAFTSFLRQLFSRRPDVYVVVSPPLLLGLCAVIISAIKQAPFVFWVQDLQPDAAIKLGMIKHQFLVRIALWIEALVYSKAACVIGISNDMSTAIQDKGVPEWKVLTVPNWISEPFQNDQVEAGRFRLKHGMAANTPLVSYCGNIGVKQDLEFVVEAAKLLAADHPAQFVICGDGTQKLKLQEVIDSYQLTNIKLLPVLETDDYWSLLVDSDVCLVTLKSGTGASFLPSKLLNILAVGRPVLTNADSGSALYQAVSSGGFGHAVDSDPKSMANGIMQLLAEPASMARMRESGRLYVQQYAKERILDGLIERLNGLCGPPSKESTILNKDAV